MALSLILTLILTVRLALILTLILILSLTLLGHIFVFGDIGLRRKVEKTKT